uniref:Uncharacterized protein n=1 Tax=Naja naja TaxID=35670 RepID=A0A8C6YM19_NAJNA
MMVSSPFELVSYLAEIFPLLHVLGANGILLEYEDMYPYDGELKPLRANDAYRYVSQPVILDDIVSGSLVSLKSQVL